MVTDLQDGMGGERLRAYKHTMPIRDGHVLGQNIGSIKVQKSVVSNFSEIRMSCSVFCYYYCVFNLKNPNR